MRICYIQRLKEKSKMANLTKRQHYVPQFYLKNFCDSTGFLWGWDKLKKGIFKCATKDICQSAFLYENELKNANPKCGKFILPNSIENTLANMEGEFSTCISQVLQICRNPANRDVLICSSKQKQILTKFAINMMLRNPVMLNGAYDGEYILWKRVILRPESDIRSILCEFSEDELQDVFNTTVTKENIASTWLENNLNLIKTPFMVRYQSVSCLFRPNEKMYNLICCGIDKRKAKNAFEVNAHG